jgi:hypothetical protein
MCLGLVLGAAQWRTGQAADGFSREEGRRACAGVAAKPCASATSALQKGSAHGTKTALAGIATASEPQAGIQAQ